MADGRPNQNPSESAISNESASVAENQIPIPQLRLQQPLPPLPRMQIQIPYQGNSPLSAYTDDSFLTPGSPKVHSRITLKDSNEGSPIDASHAERRHGERSQPPPDYEPMNDYLRALALHRQDRSQRHYSPTSNTFLSPSSRPHTPSIYMPYSDSPSGPDDRRQAIITLSPLSPSANNQSTSGNPPSYEELYLQHPCPVQQSRLLELVRELEGSESSVAEDICKFIIGLVFVIFTVMIIGMAFNWGRPIHGLATGAESQAIMEGEIPAQFVNMPKLGSMSKVGKFRKTLCGGRCKIHE
jgi:hypothetical protein